MNTLKFDLAPYLLIWKNVDGILSKEHSKRTDYVNTSSLYHKSVCTHVCMCMCACACFCVRAHLQGLQVWQKQTPRITFLIIIIASTLIKFSPIPTPYLASELLPNSTLLKA